MFPALILALLLLPTPSRARDRQPVPADRADPMIGTSGGGQTYPAAGVPFAMTQWTPETRAGQMKCIAPYYFTDRKIIGFRGSHFMSGSCTADYGSVTLMPLSGRLRFDPRERGSAFSHAEEKAKPYLYTVTLTDDRIEAAITGTSHAGILRFVFERPGKAWILVQGNSRAGDGAVTIDVKHGEIYGFNPVRRLYAGQGKPAGFSGYFVVRFNRPFTAGGTWSGGVEHADSVHQAGDNGAPGAYVSFALKPGEAVEAKVGMSFTSLDEARRNLAAEIPGWNLEQVAGEARAQWNTALAKVQIDEPSAAKQRIFYTALYHALQLPREFSDVSGAYPEFAGGKHIEFARGFRYYADFSLWDTFRAEHPLLTILDPERDGEMVRSLILKGEQGGFLPIYPAWNSYTSEMVGDHADAVIGDAYVKGIRGFDIAEAYRLMRQNAMESPPSHEASVDGEGRRGLRDYLRYGYIPLEDSIPDAFHQNEQVTRTLEYAYDDFVTGQIARALGKDADAALFAKRAQNYRNVIDPAVGFARGRHASGAWATPFSPVGNYSYITEGLPYQDTFFVPQDISGLIGLLGGPKAFISKLDGLFAGGYYDQGNEPSHQIAYLYDYVHAAWKTQMEVRKILDADYTDSASGLPGNDDCGQMSAWYVFSALGFYPVTPGTPRYEIGVPLFDGATIHLASGKTFQILAPGASEGKMYIQSVTLDGMPLDRTWISQSEIDSGGELVFHLSSLPDPDWPQQPAGRKPAFNNVTNGDSYVNSLDHGKTAR